MARMNMGRIEAATADIAAVFQNTPQYICERLSEVLGCRALLKVETLNPVRCFKGRGTETVLSRLAKRNGPTSVVCASAGNLGQALAYGAQQRGWHATVVASALANPLKLAAIRALGADVVLVDGEIEAALQTATEFANETGAFLVEDSKNLDTCEGAATIGLELAGLRYDLDAVLVSLGAGAMATGVGFTLKSLRPQTEVICVQPNAAPGMVRSFHAGHAIDAGPPQTIADGVAGRYCIPEVLNDLIELADDAVLVSEDSIIQAMGLLYRHSGLVVEPAAALGVASILEDPARYEGKCVATILCGSNVAPDDFRRWVLS